MKPRFPLSVERHFCYRAYMDDGDIYESDTFKSVYQRALCGLRCDVGNCANGWDKYQQITASFDFGYWTSYQIDTTHFYTEWFSIKKIGFLAVTPLSIWYGSYEGGSDFDYNRAYYTERRK